MRVAMNLRWVELAAIVALAGGLLVARPVWLARVIFLAGLSIEERLRERARTRDGGGA